MKIRSSLSSGFRRALKSWKGILLVWFCSLITVSLLMAPFSATLSNAFGRSMITDNLRSGFDLKVFTDLGPVLKSLAKSFSAGFLLVLFISFVLNAFLTGGLFDSLRKDRIRFSMQEFFSRASKNFWSFITISFIISLAIIFVSITITFITAIIINNSGSFSEKESFISQVLSFLMILLLLPVFLLAADYSRAWKVSNESASGLKALGTGFSLTFKRFRTSYALMLIIVICQTTFGALIIYLISVWKPATGKGVFLLFIVSQVLIYARFLLKTWRYGSVTAFLDK